MQYPFIKTAVDLQVMQSDLPIPSQLRHDS